MEITNYINIICFCNSITLVHSKIRNKRFDILLFLILLVFLVLISESIYNYIFILIVPALTIRSYFENKNMVKSIYISINCIFINFLFLLILFILSVISSNFIYLLDYYNTIVCIGITLLSFIYWRFYNFETSYLNKKILIINLINKFLIIIFFIFFMSKIYDNLISGTEIYKLLVGTFILFASISLILNKLIFKLIISEYFYRQEIRNHIKNNNTAKEVYKLLIEIRHSIKDLFGIQNYDKDKDNLLKVIENYKNRIEHVILDKELSKNLERIKVLLIKDTLYFLCLRAKNYNISLNIYVNDIITEINIDELDLVDILSAYINNSLRECEKQDNSFINILFIKDEYLYIKIENPKLSERKKQNGLGTKISQDIFKKYENIESKTTISSTMFIQEIFIYNRG